MARKTWVLDTGTKGTGANIVPLEAVLRRQDDAPARSRRSARRPESAPATERPAPERPRSKPVETARTPLPAGHVRKRATGEIGQVKAVDPKAGTATVRWLKGGSTSTVPLSALSRR